MGAARTPTASPYASGYAVALSGTAPGAPIRASFIAPSVGCTATGPVRALQVGVTLSGPLAGTGAPAVTLTISCDGQHADYTSSPALGPGQQIRPGDRLMMTLTPGAAGSTESLADATRRFRLLAHASGIAVRSIEFGIQPLSSLSIGVSPGTAKNSPSVGPTTIGAVKYDALPSFRPLTFQSCSIGGGTLAHRTDPSSTYLTGYRQARPRRLPARLSGRASRSAARSRRRVVRVRSDAPAQWVATRPTTLDEAVYRRARSGLGRSTRRRAHREPPVTRLGATPACPPDDAPA